MAIALAIPNPTNKYTCLRITVNITCSITAKAKKAPPINNTTNTCVYDDKETPNTMDNIGHPRIAPAMIINAEMNSAPAKIKPHNFMNLRYSLWTQDLDKRTNKGCKAKPTNKLVTKQGINR